MIQARIKKRFPPGRDYRGFSLDVELAASAGITVLFGPSGAGKTLTLEAIAGFVRPDEGRILLDDEILFDGATGANLAPQRRKCGYVFQNYALFPHMTLRRNLEFAADRYPRLERHRRVNEIIERFRLADVAGRRPHELSGGQQQRCSIARALIGTPRLLLLDEPARGLDLPLRNELYDVLRQVRAEFATPMLLVTHDFEECFAVGDEMVVIRDGRVVQSGSPRQVFGQPASLEVARLLGAVNVLAAEIRALDPQNNASVLRGSDFELAGPYLRGHLKGDRVSVVLRADQLTAAPADGSGIAANRIPAVLLRLTEMPGTVRLEFEGGLSVEMSAAAARRLPGWDSVHPPKKWHIEVPPEAVRAL
jgi:molybdate transport system ATP-binding protein